MPRYFVPITVDQLKEKIKDLETKHADESEEETIREIVQDVFEKDLKVEFSTENIEIDPKYSSIYGDLLGYNTLSNGMAYLGFSSGGDWEFPLFFLLYFDGKKLRAYIPKDGNPWNTTTMEAYGNDDVADGKNAKKRWPHRYDGSPATATSFSRDSVDKAAIINDITSRILLKL